MGADHIDIPRGTCPKAIDTRRTNHYTPSSRRADFEWLLENRTRDLPGNHAMRICTLPREAALDILKLASGPEPQDWNLIGLAIVSRCWRGLTMHGYQTLPNMDCAPSTSCLQNCDNDLQEAVHKQLDTEDPVGRDCFPKQNPWWYLYAEQDSPTKSLQRRISVTSEPWSPKSSYSNEPLCDDLSGMRTPAMRITAVLKGLQGFTSTTGQTFSRGAFIIEDPGNQLFQLLESDSCTRVSSHLKRLPPECGASCCAASSPQQIAALMGQTIQHGIDFTNEPFSWEAANATDGDAGVSVVIRTVLFQPLVLHDKQFLFLKPEPNGCETYQSTVLHGYDYVKSLFLQQDAGKVRKERVPQKVSNQFRLHAEEAGLTKEGDTVVQAAAGMGIGWMLKTLEAHSEYARDAFLRDIMHLLCINDVQCEQEHQLRYRIGDEVFVPADVASKIFEQI